MAGAFVDSKSAMGDGVASVTTPSWSSGATNFLAVSFAQFGTTSITGTPVNDNQSSTIQYAWLANSGAGNNGGLAYAENIAGGAGHTVTYTVVGAAKDCAVGAMEFSGVTSTGSFDQTSFGNSAAEPHVTPGSITPVQADSLIIGNGSKMQTQAVPASKGFFTDIVALADSTPEGVLLSYAISTVAQAYQFSFAYSGLTDSETSGIATFRGTNIAYVQAKSAQGSGVTTLTTAATTTTSTNFLAAIATMFNRTFSGSPMSDSKTNTWQSAWTGTAGTSRAACYFSENITGGSGHTVTFTAPGGAVTCGLAVGEFSGINTSSSLDKTAQAQTTSEPRNSGFTAIISQASELLIGGGSIGHFTNLPFSNVAGGDFVDAIALASATAGALIMSYRIANGIRPYNYEFHTASANSEAVGVTSFKLALATSPGDGTTPSATDPAAGDSLCGATVPLLYCILQKDSGSVSYSWVDQPMNEATVQREPRIVNVSKLRRELSDWSSRMVINSGNVTLTDYDGAIRAMIVANTIIRKQLDFYMIDEANWRASGTPFRVNQSLVTDYTVNPDMTVTLQFEDRFGGQSLRDLLSKPLPFRTLDTSFNATLPTQLVGKGEPIPYGLLTDEVAGFPTVQVWYTGERVMPDLTTWYEGLIAGCATALPLNTWGADGVSVDANGNPVQVKLDPLTIYDSDIAMPGLGTLWSGFFSTTNYRVVNSRRYMLCYFRVGSAVGEAFKLFSTSNGSEGVPVHINMGGVEDVGDTSGNVVESLPRQWQHLLTNFVEQNHVTDADWYAIPNTANASPYSIIDATSVETVKTRSEARLSGGYSGAFVIGHDLSRTTLGDWLQRICLGGDFDMGVDRHGRAFLSMEDPTLSPVKAFTITSILEDTYGTWKDRGKLANDITCFTFKNLTQTNTSVTLRNSSPQQPTDWLTAKRTGIAEDTTSITALGGDPGGRRTFHYEDWVTRDVLLTTSGSVQAHRLERSKDGPDYHQLETDLCGLDVELGDVFSVTHFAGLVSTTRNVRCTAIELEVPDPFTKKWAVRLFGYDVTDLVS